MRRIVGYVLVRESNSGIPNLVVAAYDTELPLEDFRRAEAPVDVIRWAGKRIASVLTDDEGRFTLPAEDLDFQGNESRPDLLLVVYAPEDVQDVKQPYPLPPEKRILYASRVPRDDAGAEEAFVIRLLQAQIERFQIPTTARADKSESSVNQLVSAVQSAIAVRNGIATRLEPGLVEERRKLEKSRALAKQKAQVLSALPLPLRTADPKKPPLLVKGKAELREKLGELQDKSIALGLERLKRASYKPTVRLSLSETEVRALGLKVEGEGVSGDVKPEQLAGTLRRLVKGVDLVRKRRLVNPSPDELERRYLSQRVQSDDDVQ